MDALAGYESDGDSKMSGDQTANYDSVEMDISEDSDADQQQRRRERVSARTAPRQQPSAASTAAASTASSDHKSHAASSGRSSGDASSTEANRKSSLPVSTSGADRVPKDGAGGFEERGNGSDGSRRNSERDRRDGERGRGEAERERRSGERDGKEQERGDRSARRASEARDSERGDRSARRASEARDSERAASRDADRPKRDSDRDKHRDGDRHRSDGDRHRSDGDRHRGGGGDRARGRAETSRDRRDVDRKSDRRDADRRDRRDDRDRRDGGRGKRGNRERRDRDRRDRRSSRDGDRRDRSRDRDRRSKKRSKSRSRSPDRKRRASSEDSQGRLRERVTPGVPVIPPPAGPSMLNPFPYYNPAVPPPLPGAGADKDKVRERLEKLKKQGGLLVYQQIMSGVPQPPPQQLGLPLPRYMNPTALNAAKFADQERKKKLLWGSKKAQAEQQETQAAAEPSEAGPSTAGVWQTAAFEQDKDGKMATKFLRLMGVKNAEEVASKNTEASEVVEKQKKMFQDMEHQYEQGRVNTHMQKGFGLGYTTQYLQPKS